MEEFRRCFENYEISNLGKCRRQLKGGEYHFVYGSIANNGYRYFQVNRGDKRINKFFHHLVAQMFVGERPEKKVIDHIDRDKLNNNHSNLRYVTHKENMQNTDKYRHDILEQDKKKRHNILNKEYSERKRIEQEKQPRRKKGSGCIRKHGNKYRACITYKGVGFSSSFETYEDADKYLRGIVEEMDAEEN